MFCGETWQIVPQCIGSWVTQLNCQSLELLCEKSDRVVAGRPGSQSVRWTRTLLAESRHSRQGRHLVNKSTFRELSGPIARQFKNNYQSS